MLRHALAALALLALVPAGPAHADAPRPAKHTAYSAYHHNGFLVRLAGGFGYARASQSGSDDVVLSGGGGAASLAFGGIIAPNLALNADLFGMSALGPKVEVNGTDIGNADNTRMTVAVVGVGLTYYVMPANLYVAASVGAAKGSIETRVRTVLGTVTYKDDSDLGVGVNAMIGKEWWVGREWGLGLAGQFLFATLPGDASDVDVLGAAVVLSATWN